MLIQFKTLAAQQRKVGPRSFVAGASMIAKVTTLAIGVLPVITHSHLPTAQIATKGWL
ncbi:MAG TPA: hypothetical protein VJS91_06130 [Nitrososphaeraceae archaeon]|nr:hypothetical protein [Nitrososphaeraceae archaeon]